jgi:hypothetical protein
VGRVGLVHPWNQTREVAWAATGAGAAAAGSAEPAAIDPAAPSVRIREMMARFMRTTSSMAFVQVSRLLRVSLTRRRR